METREFFLGNRKWKWVVITNIQGNMEKRNQWCLGVARRRRWYIYY